MNKQAPCRATITAQEQVAGIIDASELPLKRTGPIQTKPGYWAQFLRLMVLSIYHLALELMPLFCIFHKTPHAHGLA